MALISRFSVKVTVKAIEPRQALQVEGGPATPAEMKTVMRMQYRTQRKIFSNWWRTSRKDRYSALKVRLGARSSLRRDGRRLR